MWSLVENQEFQPVFFAVNENREIGGIFRIQSRQREFYGSIDHFIVANRGESYLNHQTHPIVSCGRRKRLFIWNTRKRLGQTFTVKLGSRRTSLDHLGTILSLSNSPPETLGGP